MRLLLLVSAIALAGCQSAGRDDTSSHAAGSAMSGNHAMRVGQSLALPDGSQLTYVRVVADSRCPPDVQCIRAGDADIELRWVPAVGTAMNAVLNSDPRNLQQAPNAARLGTWHVALKSLDWQSPPAAIVSVSSAD